MAATVAPVRPDRASSLATVPSGHGRHPRLAHQPALDGLRGLAVLGVILFHSELPWAVGGYLGVSTFFTLSGFLITSLLVLEHGETGRIDLRRFWSRRFRRLGPALLLTLVGTALFARFVADADQLAGIRTDALSALGYVANWRFIVDGQSYTQLFDAPSPLLHMWSLAIEEQFYVLFPLVVAGVLALARGSRRWLGLMVASLAAASVVAMLGAGDGTDTARAYYGTDTRAVELLAGAGLALVLAGGRQLVRPAARVGVAAAGAAALVVTLGLWATAEQTSGWLYRGGLAAYAVGTAAIVAAAVHPGPVRAVLSWRPLRLLGIVSYGTYLFHWPVFLWLTDERTGLSGAPLLAVRMAVTLLLATASYVAVEQPIRRGAIGRRRMRVTLPAVAAGVVAVVVVSTVAPAAPSVLAAEGREATAATSATRPAAKPAPVIRDATPADPLRVVAVGDSVAFDAAPGIAAALQATGEATVTARTALGFRLSDPPNDWRAEWRDALAAADAEVAVLMFGSWDEEFVAANGVAALRPLVDEAIDVLTEYGARVVVVGMPASVDRTGATRPRLVNTVLAELPDRWPGAVTYVDADDAVSPGGTFASHLPGPDGRPERVRKLDGVHLCPAGAARVGRAVLDTLSPAWALAPPDPSWRSGPWALDARYDDPPGACSV